MIEGHRQPCDEGVIRSGADSDERVERTQTWVLTATILGSSLAFILGSSVNVALPVIQTSLGATTIQMQWVLNSYLLTLGGLLLTGGSLGDQFGRKKIFALGTGLFTAASVWCGLVATPTGLIAARAIQGVGAALLVPGSLAIISATFPKGERGKAIGTWAAASALTTALGPVLGGWLVDIGGWRWAFLFVVPFGLVCIAITLWFMPESRDPEAGAPDWPGAITAVVGLGALAYGLMTSSEAGWGDPAVLAGLAAGAIGLAAFLWWEARSPSPMMPLGLFRSSTFTGANLITLFLYFALDGLLFFMPFNLVQIQGYSTTEAGAAFLPFTLLLGMLSRWAGGLVDRYGAKPPLVVGPTIAALGLALIVPAGLGASYWTDFFPGLLVFGLGMAISVAPLTTVVMNAVEDRRAGVASGINNAAARIAGLLAIAILGAVAIGLFSADLRDRLADVSAPESVKAAIYAERTSLAAARVPEGVTGEQREMLQQAIDASFLFGFRWVVALSAAMALGSALMAFLFVDE